MNHKTRILFFILNQWYLLVSTTSQQHLIPDKFASKGSIISISFSQPIDFVSIEKPLIIRCHVDTKHNGVSINKQISVSLYCPITQLNTFCFQNCQAPFECDVDSKIDYCNVANQLKKVSCRQISERDGQMIHEYTLNRLSPDWLTISNASNPGFACLSRGERTKWVQLRQENIFAAVTNPTYIPILGQRKQLIKQKPTESDKVPENKDILMKITKDAVVMLVMIILVLSIVVNVCWCLRCLLVKKYARTGSHSYLRYICCLNTGVDKSEALILSSANYLTPDTDGKILKKFPYHPQANAEFHVPVWQSDARGEITDIMQNDDHWSCIEAFKRVHPDGKATNSTMSNSVDRNSASGVSLIQTSEQLYTASGQPVILTNGWSIEDRTTIPYPIKTNYMTSSPASHLFPEQHVLADQKAIKRSSQTIPNYADTCDASQRSLIMRSKLQHSKKYQPNIFRASSRETMLSGFIINQPSMIQELPAMFPGSSISQTISENNSSEFGGGAICDTGVDTAGIKQSVMGPVVGYIDRNCFIPVMINGSQPVDLLQKKMPNNIYEMKQPNSNSISHLSQVQLKKISMPIHVDANSSSTDNRTRESESIEQEINQNKAFDTQQSAKTTHLQNHPLQVQNWLDTCESPTMDTSKQLIPDVGTGQTHDIDRKFTESVKFDDDAPSDWSDKDILLFTEEKRKDIAC